MEETLVFVDEGFLSRLSKYLGEGSYIKFDKIKKEKGIFKFKSKLSNINEFTILEGRVQRTKSKDGNFQYRQKGVDTVLTVALSSCRADFPTIKKIILIACDSDFVPVIKMLREKGIEIILFSYYERKRNTEFSRSHHLIDMCSNCIQLKKEDFKNCLLEK